MSYPRSSSCVQTGKWPYPVTGHDDAPMLTEFGIKLDQLQRLHEQARPLEAPPSMGKLLRPPLWVDFPNQFKRLPLMYLRAATVCLAPVSSSVATGVLRLRQHATYGSMFPFPGFHLGYIFLTHSHMEKCCTRS